MLVLDTTLTVQFSSFTQSCPTLCGPMNALQASLSITNSRSLPKLMSIESVMPSNHLILCLPLLLLPSIFPSIRVFSNESACRGPAPADPGYSKERRHRRGSGYNSFNSILIKDINSNRIRIAQ